MGSTRLPGKVLMPLVDDLTVLDLVLKRLSMAETLDEVVLAYPTGPADDPIKRVRARHHVSEFRGSERDVLGRYYDAARVSDADTVVRVTSDCPLVDPDVVDRMIRTFNEGGYDYLSNAAPEHCRTVPKGFDVEVFTMDLLVRTHLFAALSEHREHVTMGMYQAGRIANMTTRCGVWAPSAGACPLPGLNLSVDTQANLDRVREILKHLNPLTCTLREVVDLIRSEFPQWILN